MFARIQTKPIVRVEVKFDKDCDEHNKDRLDQIVTDVARLVNPVDGHYLDRQQLESIAFDVQTRLVIGSAGTGKTATLLGLVKYLLLSGKASQEEVLVLSPCPKIKWLYNHAITETGNDVQVFTFQRLAFSIAVMTECQKPNIPKMDLRTFISREIEKRRSDRNYMQALNEYLAFSQKEKDESDFRNATHFTYYLRKNQMLSIDGTNIKNFGELDIANYLAMNGVPYEYRKAYPRDTSDSEYGQYHPGFHIIGTDVYIEYFGIDRTGKVCRYLVDDDARSSEDYLRGVEWKRQLHGRYGTVLIETYAYDRKECGLLEKLERELDRAGVRRDPPDPALLYAESFKPNRFKISTTVSHFATLIQLIKRSGKPWVKAFPKGRTVSEVVDLNRTEKVVRPLYDSYQAYLVGTGSNDYQDLLNRAILYIQDGRFKPRYKYVVIDEYQDLSAQDYALLKAMHDKYDFKLYATGDDWQGISRSTGGNLSYILDFEKYWGLSATFKLKNCYRFSGELLEKSIAFISGRGRQLQKEAVGYVPDCSVEPIYGWSAPDVRKNIAQALETLPPNASVLILGRYMSDLGILKGNGFSYRCVKEAKMSSVTYEKRRNLWMTFRTIEDSRTMQSDYVILLNNKKGSYGFPNPYKEPLAVSLLLGDESDGQYENERRLFYVAITRAKKGLFVVSHGHRSKFYKELFKMEKHFEQLHCPLCGGILIQYKMKDKAWEYRCNSSLGCKYVRLAPEEQRLECPTAER